MEIQKLRQEVLSSDKQHLLVATVYVPEGEPKGLVQIVHGMQEYMGKYDEFMTRLAAEGYIVFGHDQLGHGLTADRDHRFGYFAPKYGWVYLLYDVAVLAQTVRRQYGRQLPYTLMGFSMGSFLARLFAAKFDWQDRLIVMGTSAAGAEAAMVLAAIRAVKAVYGDQYVSKAISKMLFGPFNKNFPGDGQFGWLSCLPETRSAYAEDPFCAYAFTVSAMEDIVRLCAECNKQSWYEKMNKHKPILLLSGSEDPLGRNGSDIRRICQRLQLAGSQPQLRLYDGCRHIILKEPCREEVTGDILDFLS